MNRSDLFDVSGKTILVTGGGTGIGLMMTTGYVANGANVYIVSRKESVIREVAKDLNQSGPGKCFAIKGDLATVAGCKAVVEQLTASGIDRLHVLVNNSGATWGADVEEFPEKGWTRVMDLNVKGLFFLTQACLPLLKAAGTAADPSRVINIGSIAGITPGQRSTPSYNASKAAVHHLTKSLANDLASSHINVNAIAPGLFPSGMTRFMLKPPGAEEFIGKQTPLGRIGRPSDIAGVALFLSSPASAWITGIVLPVDGGNLLPVGLGRL